MACRVLVTRPEPGATATGRRLRQLGFEPVILPLSEIRPIGATHSVAARDFAAVVATSANAVRHAPAPLLAALSELPAFAVGDETGRAMRVAGLTAPSAADGDAVSLAALIAARVPAGAAIAYLAGRVRRDTFEPALHAAGIAVTTFETYDTTRIVPDAERLARLSREGVAAVLVHSGKAAEAIAVLAGDNPAVARALERASFVCISRRVAEMLPESLRPRARAATQPTEDALMELLRKECGTLP